MDSAQGAACVPTASWEGFGRGFFTTWCRSCHSATTADRCAAYAADGHYKAVLRALTDGDRYQAGAYGPGADDTTRARERIVRRMDAPLLASVLEDLMGFTWEYGGFQQLRNDTYGYRLLGGGVDGFYATRSQDTLGLTWLVVVQRGTLAALLQDPLFVTY